MLVSDATDTGESMEEAKPEFPGSISVRKLIMQFGPIENRKLAVSGLVQADGKANL